MKIVFTTKTIEISQTFANKASHFGSMEYNELRMVMNDLPDFVVKIKPSAKPRQTYMKGLTYDYMISYIAEVDEDGSIMRDFEILRQKVSYFDVKRWFLNLFPEINNFAA